MGQKEKKELAILAVAIAILVINLGRMHQPSKSVGPKGIPVQNVILPESAKQAVSKEISAGNTQITEIKYTGKEDRDPLDNSVLRQQKPEVKKEDAFPKENFLVSAVIWGSKKPQAIINDKVVAIGEKINGWEIIGIDKKGVRVNFEGQEILLPIK